MKEKKFCHYCKTELKDKFIEGRTRLYCEKCQSPLYENPIPANALVVINENEQVLLVRRSIEPKKGFWCLPGGFMELGESPEQAALRELKEETGLLGKIEMLLGLMSNESPEYHTVLMAGYLVKEFSGKVIAGDDADEVKFFDAGNLPEIAFSSHQSFVRIYYAAYSRYWL